MTERDDNVYKAKLAEQAERYDGTWSNLGNFYPQTSPFRRVKGVAMASARSLRVEALSWRARSPSRGRGFAIRLDRWERKIHLGSIKIGDLSEIEFNVGNTDFWDTGF